MQLQFKPREVSLKLVYYGPGLSGKTTNLSQLHDRIQINRGHLLTLDTADDRTLFFDMLPLCIGNGDQQSRTGFVVRLKLYTVPGQSIHAATRRLVLNGTDGVAFIADSRSSFIEANAQSFGELKDNLEAHALNLQELPLVIQFNKRDLPEIRSDADLDALAARSTEPVYPAVASRGEGVVETFLALLQRTWRCSNASKSAKSRSSKEPRSSSIVRTSRIRWRGALAQVASLLMGACHEPAARVAGQASRARSDRRHR